MRCSSQRVVLDAHVCGCGLQTHDKAGSGRTAGSCGSSAGSLGQGHGVQAPGDGAWRVVGLRLDIEVRLGGAAGTQREVPRLRGVVLHCVLTALLRPEGKGRASGKRRLGWESCSGGAPAVGLSVAAAAVADSNKHRHCSSIRGARRIRRWRSRCASARPAAMAFFKAPHTARATAGCALLCAVPRPGRLRAWPTCADCAPASPGSRLGWRGRRWRKHRLRCSVAADAAPTIFMARLAPP